MLTGGKRGVEVEMSAKERAGYLARQCRGRAAGQGNGWENNAKESLPFKGEVLERGENDSKGNVLFLMKAGGASKEVGAVEGASKEVGGAGEDSNKEQSDVLVCAPLHSAAKAVFEQINQQVLLLMLNIDGPKVMLIFSSQMGLPCKRGHGGKIEGCDPEVENGIQRSVDKINATVNILLTRLTD